MSFDTNRGDLMSFDTKEKSGGARADFSLFFASPLKIR